MSHGVQKLSEQAWELLDAQLHMDFENACANQMSPIEVLFMLAARTYAQIDPITIGLSFSLPSDPADMEPFTLYIVPQARVLDWPVDFLLTARGGGAADQVRTAVVECDGHDFHERTKEQAIRDRSRDRRLQDAGHRVFRFPGAEIHRDPMGCAREVFRWAYDAWLGEFASFTKKTPNA